MIIVSAYMPGGRARPRRQPRPACRRTSASSSPTGCRPRSWAIHGRAAAKEAGAGKVVVQAIAGDPAEVLLEAAKDFDAELIVVGSRGLNSHAHFILGSVAASVAHHAPCDVLVAHTTAEGTGPVHGAGVIDHNGPMTDETNAASEKTPIEVAVEHAVEAARVRPDRPPLRGCLLAAPADREGQQPGHHGQDDRQVRRRSRAASEATKAAGRLQDQAAGVLDFIGGTGHPDPRRW